MIIEVKILLKQLKNKVIKQKYRENKISLEFLFLTNEHM